MARKPSPNLTPAAVEATAAAFLAAFKAPPAKAKSRFVEMLDNYEDELDATQLMADMAANPEDFDLRNSVPWEQVKAEMSAARQANQAEPPHRKAA